jgi:Domain of unknown function (DUF4139)/N-terminal domain of unknown function (DUF4140)
MSKRIYLLSGLSAAALTALGLWYAVAAEPGVNGNGGPKTASSRVSHVTVYPTNALVTREVDVPPGTGTFELVVNPLPVQTVNSSLYSEGSEGIRILTTRFRTRPIKEDTREEVRKLEDEQRKLHFNGQRIQMDIMAIEQNVKMLMKLEDFKSRDNSESIIALSKYVMESRAEKSKELVGLQQQLVTNQEQLEFVKRQLQDLTAGTSKVERDAVIVVDKATSAPSKVRLNYLVDSAAWRPQYKLRADKNDKGTVLVEYLAAVVQQTGEDWSGVAITLSTAAPTLNAAPPDLHTLEVAVMPRGSAAPMPTGINQPNKMEFAEQGKKLRGQVQQEYLTKNPGNAALIANQAAAIDATWQLLYCSREEILATMKGRGGRDPSDEGPSVTYHIPTRISVPSRPDEQIIEVAKIDMKPEFFYKTVPALAQHVYRQATVSNDSKYVLLPGEATMYQGTDFVGRMNLPLVAVGEQFTAGFGVDPQLQVQRVMVDKQRTTQGGNQVHKFEYRILLSSYKPEAVSLQVWDRLPHAETESVGISLQKTTPELSKDALYLRESRPQNLLRWDVKIDNSMNGEKALAINYEFQMALDKQMTVGSFQTK